MISSVCDSNGGKEVKLKNQFKKELEGKVQQPFAHRLELHFSLLLLLVSLILFVSHFFEFFVANKTFSSNNTIEEVSLDPHRPSTYINEKTKQFLISLVENATKNCKK